MARKLRAWFTRFPPSPRVAAADEEEGPPGRAARGWLGWRVKKKRRRRPMPCLVANKYC